MVRKLSVCLSLFTVAALLSLGSAKASAQPVSLSLHAIHPLLASATDDGSTGDCEVLSSGLGYLQARCCPPPGMTGSCITIDKHYPLEYLPPSGGSCSVWWFAPYSDPAADFDNPTSDIEPLSLSCE